MEDFSPQLRNTHRNGEEGGKIGKDSCRRDKSAQETKERLEQGTTKKMGDIQDMHPDEEEEQHIGATHTKG
jgi:hypothetical protein